MYRLVPLLTFLAAAAGAAESPTMTLWAGAGGYVRDDCVAPVFVVLDNDTTDRDGYVSVRFSSLGSTTGEARSAVPLPANSRKSVFLYVPNMGRSPDQVMVTYHDTRGRRVNSIEQKLRSVPPWMPIVAGVGSSLPGGLPPHQTENGEPLYTRLFVEPDRLPENAIGLEMFDAIIISPPPQEELKRQQIDALRTWTMRGGTLIVDASERTNAFTQGMFASLLPFVPERIESLDATELGTDETITAGTLQHNADVLFQSGDKPLVARRNLGLGSITTFAIPPDAVGMKRWVGRSALWSRILLGARVPAEPREPSLTQQLEEDRRSTLMNNVRTAQQTGLRLGLVLLLTLVYALVVGPGDYLFIKWLGKPKMTWVTFPAIVVVFTAAAWWGAKAWVGGDMASMHLRRTIVFPELGAATRYDLMGLFVPAGRRYTVEHQDAVHVQEIQSTLGTNEAPTYDVDSGVIEQRIPIWKWRIYGATYELEDSYPQVDLLVDTSVNPRLVTISNQSDRILRGNSLMYRNRMWRLPEIRPGQKFEWELGPENERSRSVLTEQRRLVSGVVFNTHEHWAHARQFGIKDALRRSAYIFVSEDAGMTKNPLVIDGEPRPEVGREMLHVVTYPRSAQ